MIAMEGTGNEMHSLMDERRKSKNVNNERRKEWRKEELKKTEKIIEESHNVKHAYLESTCNEISRT